MEHYFGVTKDADLTNDEIEAVQSIVMEVAAGKVKAQVREVKEQSKNRNR